MKNSNGNPAENNLGVSTDTDRKVYKRVSNEIFEMVEFMSNHWMDNLSKIVDNPLCESDYIVIHKVRLNMFNVKKYNGLGNLFEFDLYTYPDTHEINYFYTKHKLTFKKRFDMDWFIKIYSNDSDRYFQLSKYEMKMSKHNLDLEQLTCFI